MIHSEMTAAIRKAGLRVTPQRLAILAAVDSMSHANVDEIVSNARLRLGSISFQAAYGALEALGTAGLIRRIEPARSPARFESRVGDNHHHVVCRICAATSDIDCAVGSAPCLEPSQTHGFLLDEAEVTFWGICPSCQENSGALDQVIA